MNSADIHIKQNYVYKMERPLKGKSKTDLKITTSDLETLLNKNT